MADYRTDVAPAMAGMATGLFFIALLSLTFKPPTALPDNELVSRAQETQEAKALLEKFPDARMSVVDGQAAQVTFRVTRYIGEEEAAEAATTITSSYPSGSGAGIRELVLKIIAEQSGGTRVLLVCVGPTSCRLLEWETSRRSSKTPDALAATTTKIITAAGDNKCGNHGDADGITKQ